MKIEFESKIIPVLGWSDLAECKCYKHLAQDMNEGEEIIYNTRRELEDDGLCAYIFYKNYPKRILYSVHIGRIHFIGRHPDHSAPFVFVFNPLKKVEVECVGYCECCGEPQTVILKSKKL
ncbi:MAG: hypothetical protein OZ930_08195 [Ignavibacteria bacterium]|nr:hypothetical protein [Ignavibacteria bacterium]